MNAKVMKIDNYNVCVNLESEKDSLYGIDVDGNRGVERSWISGYEIVQVLDKNFSEVKIQGELKKYIENAIDFNILNGNY